MEAESLRHANEKTCQCPAEIAVIVALDNGEKDGEGLEDGHVCRVEKIGFGQSLLKGKAKLGQTMRLGRA